eukprot:2927854-Pleurochrysis_carterae.AAC.2
MRARAPALRLRRRGARRRRRIAAETPRAMARRPTRPSPTRRSHAAPAREDQRARGHAQQRSDADSFKQCRGAARIGELVREGRRDEEREIGLVQLVPTRLTGRSSIK